MGVRAKFRSFINGFKFRFFELPKRMDDIVKQFEDTLISINEHHSLTLDNTMRLTGYDSMFHSNHLDMEKEKKLRLEQAKRTNNRVKTFGDILKDLVAKVDFNHNDLSEKTEQLFNDFLVLHSKIAGQDKKDKELIKRLEWALKNFSKIEEMAKSASDQYENFLTRLKKDISEFKETDHAIRRLAHLEERITLIEIHNKGVKSHGSGETTSRSITANQEIG